MPINLNLFISIILSLLIGGCSTVTTQTIESIDTKHSSKLSVYIDSFQATKSRGALFVQGVLVNKSGNMVSSVILEANGYDKEGNLVSTDKIELSPNVLKNREKVSFDMTFVKDVEKIDKYYFFGGYEMTKVTTKVNMDTLGVVLLAAGAVVALSAAAYYSSSYYNSAPNYVNSYNSNDYNSIVYRPSNNIKNNYLGTLSRNSYNPNAVSNPYGQYGNKFSPRSINNPYGQYGSQFSPNSVNNPYATNTPKLYSQDGKYLGKLSSNPYDPESVSNPYGQYGNKFSSNSVNNPYGTYGSPYSSQSANNPYATNAPKIYSSDGKYIGDKQ